MTTPRYHPALAELVALALSDEIDDSAHRVHVEDRADSIQSLISQPKQEVVTVSGGGEGDKQPKQEALQGTTPVDPEALNPYMDAMKNEAIPAMIADAKRQAELADIIRRGGHCSQCKQLSSDLATEHSIRHAWEKRAYQAEAELIALQAKQPKQERRVVGILESTQHTRGHSVSLLMSDGSILFATSDSTEWLQRLDKLPPIPQPQDGGGQ